MAAGCLMARRAFFLCLLFYCCEADFWRAGNSIDNTDAYIELAAEGKLSQTKLSVTTYEGYYPAVSAHAYDFLYKPVRLAKDSRDHIHILDYGSNCIYEFDSDGDPLNQIGTKGSGPGDFLRPSDFVITNDRLYVSEIGNFRIQQLSISGMPERFTRKYLTQYSMTCDEDGLIYIAPLVYGGESQQIAVINNSGEVVRAFGTPIVFARDNVTLNFVYLERNSKDELFSVYRYFPIIRKYSKEGKLLSEYLLKNAAMKRTARINYDRSRSRKARLKEGYVLNVIAIRIFNDHLFLLCQSTKPLVLEYDERCRQIEIYKFNQDGPYIAKDFIVFEDAAGNKTFHLLQVFPESRVDIYSEITHLNQGGLN